jgi:acyl-CoA thioester hydrolase
MSNLKELFPYKADSKRVTAKMCDINGHMNVAYYLETFDVYSRSLFESLGFSQDYFIQGFSCFAIEDNIRYLNEFLEGDKIYPRFRIHNYNHKLIHVVGVLLNKDEELSSISETIVAHIDMTQRRTMNMPKRLFQKVAAVSVEHCQKGPINFDLRLSVKK